MSLPRTIDEVFVDAPASALSGSDLVPISQGGLTKVATVDQLAIATTGTSSSFLQSGTGAVARTVQSKERDVVSVKDFGATGDGATDDSSFIQSALNISGGVYFPKPSSSYYLGTTGLTIGSNTSIIFAKGAKFTANTSVQANLPNAFITINANATDIEIEGAFLDYVSSPYSSYDTSHRGVFIWIKGGAKRIRITKCRTMWPMHSVFSDLTDAGIEDISIIDNDFTSTDCDIFLQGVNTKNVTITNNRFPNARPAGFFSPGSVRITSGMNPGDPTAPFTQSNYDSDFSSDIVVSNNTSFQPAHRPYAMFNVIGLTIAGNIVDALLGTTRAQGGASCDDIITLDFVRNFSVTGNTLKYGGENGIDVLSCQHGVISSNSIWGVNTVAMMVDFSEIYSVSLTSPKLSSLTDRTAIANRDIVISDNVLNGGSIVAYIGNAQGVQVSNNKLSYNKLSSNRTTIEPILITINDAEANYALESVNNWLSSIRMYGNTYDQGTSKSVTVDSGTEIFTSATKHEFTTGDRIEFYVSGTAVTWAANDFPGGINYYDEFYAIRLSDTTFKIATTYANALTGTAINITDNGLHTAGSVLLVGLARGFTNQAISATRTDPNLDWKLDENIPVSVPPQLFSTLSAYTPGNSHLMNWKFELFENPEVDYGSGNPKLHQGKYIPVHDRKYSDGTNTYGIEVTVVVQNTYVIATGARIAQVAIATDGFIRASFW